MNKGSCLLLPDHRRAARGGLPADAVQLGAHPRHLPAQGVCEKNTPLEKKTGWKISSENTKSVAGLQFLLLGRMAKAQVKGVFFHRHRHHDAVLCGAVRYGKVRYGAVRHSTARYSSALKIQYCTFQNSSVYTLHKSATRYDTIRYHVVRYCMIRYNVLNMIYT